MDRVEWGSTGIGAAGRCSCWWESIWVEDGVARVERWLLGSICWLRRWSKLCLVRSESWCELGEFDWRRLGLSWVAGRMEVRFGQVMAWVQVVTTEYWKGNEDDEVGCNVGLRALG
uniref:Uncharacterized protein n=1 Tax=Cannabis sativa TaxID=3483 RepID=A0A803NRZ0_CANSA